MPNCDVTAHMCTAGHIWFLKVVTIWASISKHLKGGVVARLGCLNSVEVVLWESNKHKLNLKIESISHQKNVAVSNSQKSLAKSG